MANRMRRCTGFRPSRTSGSARPTMTDIALLRGGGSRGQDRLGDDPWRAFADVACMIGDLDVASAEAWTHAQKALSRYVSLLGQGWHASCSSTGQKT